MHDAAKDKIARAVYRGLVRYKDRNPIEAAELISIAIEGIVDSCYEESGIATIPAALAQAAPGEPAWDMDTASPAKAKIAAPPPARNAIEPAQQAPAQRLVALPGEKEFQQADPAAKQAAPQRKVVSAIEVRRKTGNRPGRKSAEPQWADGDLMDAINKGTPDYLDFTPEGTDLVLRAYKNCHFMPGIGAQLTYKHPAVAESDGFLVAKHAFSLFAEELDLTAAEESIRKQLATMYKPRNPTMEPASGPEPGPLRLDMRSQPGDSAAIHLRAGESVADPMESVMRSVQRGNDSLAPAGHRF